QRQAPPACRPSRSRLRKRWARFARQPEALAEPSLQPAAARTLKRARPISECVRSQRTPHIHVALAAARLARLLFLIWFLLWLRLRVFLGLLVRLARLFLFLDQFLLFLVVRRALSNIALAIEINLPIN